MHYVIANSFSQKLWSFIRDRSEFDLHVLVETYLPTARHDQISDQLRAVGWKLAEFTAARPSPRSAKGTIGGAAILARSHLRVDSSLDVLSCANPDRLFCSDCAWVPFAHSVGDLLPHGFSGR